MGGGEETKTVPTANNLISTVCYLLVTLSVTQSNAIY